MAWESVERSRQPSSDRSPPTPVQGADTIVLADSDDAEALRSAAIGGNVGRYVVLEEIGRGGMGRVLRAYDPKLQREVALKEVRGRLLGPEGASRLVAEARAMAKLAHPNVVAVYDVEELAHDEVVLVMEHVAGRTLTKWANEPRTWQDIVACFRRAGRGLAAAHAAGLLHRDFKPDNVLIAAGNVVKVTDFGLAKIAAQDPSASASLPMPETGAGSSESDGLTATGVVMGTPRFMAPEQHRGDVLGPAADQYAFCVALWEALAGAAPFDGAGLEQLERAKAKGPPAWPGGAAPRPIVDAILRGLAVDGSRRWPSMDALLDALAPDPGRRRRRWLQLAAAVGVVGVGVVGLQAWAATRAQRCAEADAIAHLGGAWDDERRTEVNDAVLGVGATYAADVWARSENELDEYAAAWTAMHVETCAATSIRGEQSTAVMDLRMACLQRARVELAAATNMLAHADAQTLQNAHEMLADLRPLDRCADVEALQADVEPPLPDEAERVAQVRERLASAAAARKVAHYQDARREIDAAKALVGELDYLPLRTELLVEAGTLLERIGDYAAAEPTLREALGLALASRQWEAVQDAAAELVYVVGFRLQRFDESVSYLDLARGLAQKDPKRDAFLAIHLSFVAHLQGKGALAESEARRALALYERALGAEHTDTALAHHTLANALFDLGRYEEAEREARRAIELTAHALGSDHPEVTNYRNSLAATLQARGELAEAETEYRRVLELNERTLGPDHADTSTNRGNLAIVLNAQGKHAEAETQVRRALAALPADHPDVARCRNTLAVVLVAQARYADAEVESRKVVAYYEEALGPEHPNVATVRDVLGVILFKQGKLDEAVAEHRAALALREKVFGAEHPHVATSLHNLGTALHKQGALEEAESVLRRAVASREQLLGPDHAILALTRGRLAGVLLDLRSVAEARTLAEAAWTRRQRDDVPPVERAETALVLAQVCWAGATVDDRRRALELGERARLDAEAAGDAGRTKAEEARTWLAEHR